MVRITSEQGKWLRIEMRGKYDDRSICEFRLCKQARNGVTVNVIEAIADKMKGEQDEIN